MSDCEHFEQLCSNCVDGTLTDDERTALDAHLAGCPSCAALLEDLKKMHELFSAEVELPAGLHESIMKRVEGQGRLTVIQPEKPVRRMPVFTMVAAAAVVVVVALGGGIGTFFGTDGLSLGKGSADTTASADASAAPEMPMLYAADGTEGAVMSRSVEEDSGESETAGTEPANTEGAPAEDATVIQSGMPPVAAAGDDASQPRGAGVGMAAAENVQKIILPQEIQGMSVAGCYLAVGSATLPSVAADSSVAGDPYSFYIIKNENENTTVEQLKKAGFTVSLYDNTGLVPDSSANIWLLIVEHN